MRTHILLGPTAIRQARTRRAVQATESRVDAVLKSNEKILNQLNPSWGGQQVNRLTLVQADSWPFKPLLGFFLGPENGNRFGQNFREFPRTPALLGIELLDARGGMALVGTMTHSNRFGEGIIPAKKNEVLNQMRQRSGWEAAQQHFMRLQRALRHLSKRGWSPEQAGYRRQSSSFYWLSFIRDSGHRASAPSTVVLYMPTVREFQCAAWDIAARPHHRQRLACEFEGAEADIKYQGNQLRRRQSDQGARNRLMTSSPPRPPPQRAASGDPVRAGCRPASRLLPV